MQAEILSIGTELLLGEITDTNAQYISRRLKELGIDVYRRTTIGDNLVRLRTSLEESLSRADIVISTGGLGPTGDDITAKALAEALGTSIQFSEEAFSMMMGWYKARGRVPGESARKQAMIVEGSTPLPNRQGTAPGQAYIDNKKMAFLLPGPPREMIPMFEESVVPLILKRVPGLLSLHSKSLRLTGIGEATVHDIVRDLMEKANPSLASYAGEGEVRLRIAARGHNEAESQELVESVEKEVRQRLREYIYGEDDDTLEGSISKILKKRNLTIAVAESITGGLVSHRLTSIPGSSSYMKLGIVAYSPDVKSTSLGIAREIVSDNDSVNPTVARQMAESVRSLSGASLGVALTGFAGPTGGTPQEPIGTVYCALAAKDSTRVDRQTFAGNRAWIRRQAAQRVLYILWRYLMGFKPSESATSND
jgi:nicotinamide-nucleotide amidase